jgi:hypothetical protein
MLPPHFGHLLENLAVIWRVTGLYPSLLIYVYYAFAYGVSILILTNMPAVC